MFYSRNKYIKASLVIEDCNVPKCKPITSKIWSSIQINLLAMSDD